MSSDFFQQTPPKNVANNTIIKIESGKNRFRSGLAYLLSGITEIGVAIGAASEVAWAAILILDDIGDNTMIRRGKASAWRKFGLLESSHAASLGFIIAGRILRDKAGSSFAEGLEKSVELTLRAQIEQGVFDSTASVAEVLKNYFNKNVDSVVLGEGEIPLLGLLDNLIKQKGDLRQIRGIAYRAEDQVVSNPRAYISDLDSLPLPALDLLPLQNYPKKAGKEFTGTLSTGRGCPFGCKFCSQSAFWERKVRFRSSQKVLEIVDMMVKKYSFNYIRILDDIFPLRPKEALQIAQGLKKRGLKWECQARIDSVSESLLRDLAKTNLDRVFFGIESGSPKIQRATGKELDPAAIKRIIAVARDAGIRIKVSFQIGTPGETKEDVDLSIKLAQELDVDEIALFVSTPFPGIPLYQIAVENKLLESINPDDCDPSVASMGTGFMSREEVEQKAQKFLESVEKATWGHHSRKGRVLRKLE